MTAAPRPSALFIAPAMPALTGNGLAMRLGMFLQALAQVAEVELVVLPIVGPAAASDALPVSLRIQPTIVQVVGRADTAFELISRLKDPKARVAAFGTYGRGSLAAYVSAAVMGELQRHIDGRRFDLVHVGRAYLGEAALAIGHEGPRTIDLDEDDAASYRGTAKLSDAAGRNDAAAWASREADAADALLDRLQDQFAAFFIAGAPDRDAVHSKHPQIMPELVENGVLVPPKPIRNDDGATLIFVGSFGYAPNVDAMLWFANDIWPLIRRSSTPRLQIVGRNMPEEVAALAQHQGIEIIGEVDDLAPAYAAATLAVAPLRAGAGTRIKLIEAAAHGVPIVATSIAAQGLAFGAPESLWIGDEAEAFAAAVLGALANPAERGRRAMRAAIIAGENYDRAKLVERISCRFRELLAK